MTKRMGTVLLSLSVILAVASCASIQRARDASSVETLAALINARDAETLIAMSQLPFLLDQEIVVLDRDVAAFWRTALDRGFRVEEPQLERGIPITEDSYREFYDSMEVRAFFSKYLKRNTRLLEMRTGDGRRMLLLVTYGWFSRTIHGFKGPF